VNIAALSGKISNIKRSAQGVQFTVYDPRYGILLMLVDPKQKVAPPNATQEVALDRIAREKVKFVNVVGLKLKEKLVKASRLSVSYE